MNLGNSLVEQLDVLYSLSPEARTANTYNGAAVTTKPYRRALAVVRTGTVPTGGTVDVKIQYKNAAGNFVDLLNEAGSAAVAFRQLVAADDDVTLVGEIPLDEIPVNDQLRMVAVVAGATVPFGGHFILGNGFEYPTPLVNQFKTVIGVGAR